MVNNDSSGWVFFVNFCTENDEPLIAQDQCVFVSFCIVVTKDSKIGLSCCRCLVFTKEFFILFLGRNVCQLFVEDFGRIIDNWKLHLGMLTTYSYFKNFWKPILVMMIHWSWFGRTTLDFISCSWHLLIQLLNCIELNFNAIVHENQFLFFHWLISWSSLAVRTNLEPKYCSGYEEQCQLSIIIMLKKMNQRFIWQILLRFFLPKDGKCFWIFFWESIQIILLFYITYLGKKTLDVNNWNMKTHSWHRLALKN
jgi:hypothetical protein